MWAGNKAYNIGAYTGKAITGPTSAGILAGTAIALTYKYSAIAARHQFPIQKPGHEIGNRSIVMMTSVLALTALAIRRLNSKFSSHQMSLIGALSYASIATVASIFAVGITSDVEGKHRDSYDIEPDTICLFMNIVQELGNPLAVPLHLMPQDFGGRIYSVRNSCLVELQTYIHLHMQKLKEVQYNARFQDRHPPTFIDRQTAI